MNRFAKTTIFIICLISFSPCLPKNIVLAANPSNIGDVCINDVTNADCEIDGADLDCESSLKKDAAGNNLKYCDCASDDDCDIEYGKPTYGSWECSDGAAYTYDLDYCYNSVTKEVKTPAGIDQTVNAPARLVDAIFDGPAAQAGLLQEVKTFKPGLEIRLPGLEFSDLANTVDEEGYLHIPWIGEFIKAVYNFGLVIVSIVAVVMIVMQGARIVVGGGESKVESYKKIGQIVVGLFIAWGSYAILYTINPALVEFKSLKVKYIEPESFETPTYNEGPDDGDFETSVDESAVSSISFTGGTGSIQTPSKQKPNCLIDTFSPGQTTGKTLPSALVTNFDLFNMSTPEINLKKRVRINIKILDALKKVHDDVLASSDAELQAYLQYMRDYRDSKVPNIGGSYSGQAPGGYNGDGVFSVSLRESRGDYDTHTLGIAIDIFPPNNWDLHTSKYTGTKGRPAAPTCAKYKKIFEKMKAGEYDNKDENGNPTGIILSKDPYKIFNRIEKKINSCLNEFDGYKDPWTTLPNEMVKIFQQNGFYWAGYGWAMPGKPIVRTDSMHFEYFGTCAKW